jgi:hypothetical protein
MVFITVLALGKGWQPHTPRRSDDFGRSVAVLEHDQIADLDCLHTTVTSPQDCLVRICPVIAHRL